jgi:hypothetical protein
MYNVGAYTQMPSRTEIRQLWAETKAENVTASHVEGDSAASAVIDDVNSVRFAMRRADGWEFDTNQNSGEVSLSAAPKSLNFLQRATGFGETPIEEIANLSKDEVTNVSGTLDSDGLDVVVSFSGDKEPLVYGKNQDEAGNVFFRRGNDLVTVDVNGNLVMQSLAGDA